MTVFFLLRHAHADWAPDEQRPLSARGHKDAGRVADVLGHLGITLVCSSPFQRARQTVEPLAGRLGLPVHIEPGLRERDLGDWSAVPDFFTAVERAWLDPSSRYPGGESNAAAQRRGVSVVHSLLEQHSGEQIVLSTHGNLLALVLQHFCPSVDYAFWKALTMPDVYELRVEGDGMSIDRLWQG